MCSEVFSTSATFLPGGLKEFVGFGKVYFDCVFLVHYSGDPLREDCSGALVPVTWVKPALFFFRVSSLGTTLFCVFCVRAACSIRARVSRVCVNYALLP